MSPTAWYSILSGLFTHVYLSRPFTHVYLCGPFTHIYLCGPFTHVYLCGPFTHVYLCVPFTHVYLCGPFTHVYLCGPFTHVYLCGPFTHVYLCGPFTHVYLWGPFTHVYLRCMTFIWDFPMCRYDNNSLDCHQLMLINNILKICPSQTLTTAQNQNWNNYVSCSLSAIHDVNLTFCLFQVIQNILSLSLGLQVLEFGLTEIKTWPSFLHAQAAANHIYLTCRQNNRILSTEGVLSWAFCDLSISLRITKSGFKYHKYSVIFLSPKINYTALYHVHVYNSLYAPWHRCNDQCTSDKHPYTQIGLVSSKIWAILWKCHHHALRECLEWSEMRWTLLCKHVAKSRDWFWPPPHIFF